VIGSIRAVASEERKAAQEKVWNEIEVGAKYHGTVKSLTSYGAFVDIGGVDGMVHVSELSWNRIKTPADVVAVGDEIDVYVISYDPEKRKISLGYKTAEMNPWNQFMMNYNVGDVVDAKVVKLMTFGAFAEILPGVDGLIHISQIADKRIGKPEDVLAEGQDVKVKITDVDAENKRISLSIRALLTAEEVEEAITYIFEMSEAHRNQLTYWYMYAAHGFVRPLIGLVSPEFAGKMRKWYEDHHPRQDRLPVQREVFKLLKKREKA
jgi:4-hydroxy-3-methylbut-2-enyl diphosphate reductase